MMPPRGDVEKHGLQNLVLALLERGFTAPQIRETVRVERGVDLTEGAIYKFAQRARDGKVPEARDLLKTRDRPDYREEIEQLFSETIELKDLAYERAKEAKDSAELVKVLREFANLGKKILDNAKILAEMDGRLLGVRVSGSTGRQRGVIRGEDLIEIFDEIVGDGPSRGPA